MQMNLFELFLLSIGLSMDAFAVAIGIGLCMAKADIKKALIVGLYFGAFQAGMPVIGYIAAVRFAEPMIQYNRWVAFSLLFFLGGKMIWGGFKKENDEQQCGREPALGPSQMLPLAVATSVDAMAVGISFAFLQVSIVPAISLIGVTTLVISMIGVKVGNSFGSRFESKAAVAGGVILILIGLRILLG